MEWLNGSHAAGFNRRHKRWGHLFGDRFHAFPDEKLTSKERLVDKVQ
ncbi:MAG: hypothetical protein ACSLFQ_07970 [Thermoanaerobaculia bacterium]